MAEDLPGGEAFATADLRAYAVWLANDFSVRAVRLNLATITLERLGVLLFQLFKTQSGRKKATKDGVVDASR